MRINEEDWFSKMLDAAGPKQILCNSPDHNDDIGCSNPNCWKYSEWECQCDPKCTSMCLQPYNECLKCGQRDCPYNEPLHYHHDACPACYIMEQKRITN